MRVLVQTSAGSEAGGVLLWQLRLQVQTFTAQHHPGPLAMSHRNHLASAGADWPPSRGFSAGLDDRRMGFSVQAPIVPPVGHCLWTTGDTTVLAGEFGQLCAFAQTDPTRNDSSLRLDRH